MYIKKSKIIISVIAIILITSFITICAINPFGIANTMEFLNFSIGTRLIELMYYDNVDMKNAAESALAGVALSTGDPYTGYIWGEDAVEYMEDIEGNYCGVGMYIEWDSETDLISVVSPIAGSPAEKAGLMRYDIVTHINDVQVTEHTELKKIVSESTPGDVLHLKVWRNGQTIEIELTVGETIQNATK